jgi:hypothetical protein
MMAETGHAPTFSDDEYTFSGLEEFIATRGTRPRTITISGKDGPSVTLSRWKLLGTSLQSGYGSSAEELTFRLRELLLLRRRFLARHISAAPFYSICVAAWLVRGGAFVVTCPEAPSARTHPSRCSGVPPRICGATTRRGRRHYSQSRPPPPSNHLLVTKWRKVDCGCIWHTIWFLCEVAL